MSGRRRAGAHRRSRTFACACTASSTRFRSRPARATPSQESRARVRSHPLSQATDSVGMHLPAAVKGLSVRSRSAPPRRKQAEGQRDPAPSRARKRLTRRRGDHARRTESWRVRPDHVSCCIAHPLPSNRRPLTSGSSDRVGATGEGIPGRGSSVRFTSCVASRPWLFEYVRNYFQRRTTRSATGVSEVAHVRCISTRRQRSIRGRAAPPKRATAS